MQSFEPKITKDVYNLKNIPYDNLAILRPISQTIFMEPRTSEIREIKTF